ncbi:RTC4-like domain-containing protein [Crucibulum laeve]|uniref:Restriction of telomere capping protein 4 n=1 Tax=Crucibulum laeve TaxID=68775 RepID=A0A5C3M2I4_9AGAR|nr:RTC4-like domain-containing protein [Crucibulum laeve]
MEKLNAELRHEGTTLFDSRSQRLQKRPHENGRAFDTDFGVTKFKTSSQASKERKIYGKSTKTRNEGSKTSRKTYDALYSHPDSEDELNIQSSDHGYEEDPGPTTNNKNKKQKERNEAEVVGLAQDYVHRLQAKENAMKGLRFGKKKNTERTMTEEIPLPSTSQGSYSKQNGYEDNSRPAWKQPRKEEGWVDIDSSVVSSNNRGWDTYADEMTHGLSQNSRSSFQSTRSKENGRDSGYPSTSKSRQDSWSSHTESANHIRPLRDRSPNYRTSPPRSTKASIDIPILNNPRPKPRPIPKLKAPVAMSSTMPDLSQEYPELSAQAKTSTQSAPDVSHSAAATRVKKVLTVKKPSFGKRSNPFDALSPLNSSERYSHSPSPRTRKKSPAEFPLPISRPSSPAPRKKKQSPAEFPLPLSPSSEPLASKSKKVVKLADFPMSPPKSAAGGKPKPKPKGVGKNRTILLSDDDDDGDISDMGLSMNVPKPFPMSTQFLQDIGSPAKPRDESSRNGKRDLEGLNSDDERRRKRRKEHDAIETIADYEQYDFEEEDSILAVPAADPRTLCPYCDTALPSSPSPLLVRLLEVTAKKSHRDPRPTNLLGRKATLATFIAVCQRHRFESQILPEAEAKGWPKKIDWKSLGARIEQMKADLKMLIEDPGDDLELDENGDEIVREWYEDVPQKGPRAKCVFWKEIMKEVKKKGSRAVVGVKGQFTNFEKAQPGYYGELGSIIIHQTLYNLFPPTSFDPTLISPLTANEFVQRILVPEVAVRLIMEDKGLEGDSAAEEAVKILRDSSAYGVSMFPEDGGEGGGGLNKNVDDDEMGIGDLIVMERAKKRRKELAEEDEREEEERKRIEEQTAELKKKAKPKKRTRIGKSARTQVDTDVSEAEPAEMPRPKPRPRPLGKAGSQATVVGDTEALSRHSSQNSTNTDYDTNAILIETDMNYDTNQDTQCRRRSPTVDRPKRLKRTSSRSTSVDVDLCSSNADSSGADDAVMTRVKSRRKRFIPPPSSADIAEEDEDTDVVDMKSTMVTPIPKRGQRMKTAEVKDDDDTPRASRSLPQPSSSLPQMNPLARARERKLKKKGEVAQPTPLSSKSEHMWLLSDESQSSIV